MTDSDIFRRLNRMSFGENVTFHPTRWGVYRCKFSLSFVIRLSEMGLTLESIGSHADNANATSLLI